MNITPYNQIRSRLNTLTVINCEHERLLWKWVGHTAGIYKNEVGQLMCFESTTKNIVNGLSGVQLTPFGTWLQHYPGKVFVRIPEFKEVARDLKMYHVKLFVEKHLGSSYPNLQTWSGRMKLILSSLDFNIFGRDFLTYTGDDAGIFCSELIAMWYSWCGYLSYKISTHEYEPDNFREGGKAEKYLIDCKWSEEIRIK